ncbi:glutamate dehydrogenase [Allokutzneria sp. NRRL B-24872]|uniref:terpene synthase family protein n=1 Tax=Allokutzneria sp. NRRL B-24872 TaxID=1137961 RepID=UPI001178A71F|nr:glutamate dehydrogenase [Allokutzneria sp. NRRL B-24872]
MSPTITVQLPPMYFPAALKAHSRIDVLEERGLAWMARYGFCADPVQETRVRDSRSAHFFGYLCPMADVERLQPAVDWAYLMFVFDDVPGDGDPGSMLDFAVRIVRTLEAPDADVLPRDNPFSAPIIDLATRVHRSCSPEHVRRLADSHLKWLLGASWEIVAAKRSEQSLNDYLSARVMYAGAEPTFTWCQLSEAAVVAEREITSPRVRALTEMTGVVAAIDNDLYSRGKDLWVMRSQPEFTGIHQTGLDLAECVALRDRIVARFFELRNEVLPTASPPLARYLHNLTCTLRGNFEWGLETGRYSNPDGDHPGAIQTLATVSDTPSAVGPPGLPSVDWWWR